MGEVIQFAAEVLGDGARLDAGVIIDSLKSTDVNSMGIQALAAVYLDAEGNLQCASTDGRAETIALFERAKAQLIAGYLD